VRVFVSHAGRDRAWAEWITWQLDRAGVDVELDCWDWQPGDNFVARMNNALDQADAMVAVFSRAYFDAGRWTSEEWQAAIVRAKQQPGFLRPIRIDDTAAPPLLSGLITTSIHHLPTEQGKRAVVSAVLPAGRPTAEPPHPDDPTGGGRDGEEPGPRRPGSLPAVWGEVPPRNEAFTGRDGMLVTLRDRLCSAGRSVVHALHGTGGVGKTQLVTEYVWRFANEYEAVWWVAAEQPGLIGEQYAALAAELHLVDPATGTETAVAALQRWCRARARWLVVLDNATTADDVRPWLLPGGGHVIVTSRDPYWPELATAVSVDVFDRRESTALLHDHRPGLSPAEADSIAEELGDLPLALAQAAAVLSEGMSATQYRQLLSTSTAELMSEGTPGSYPQPLAAATAIALDQATTADPSALPLLRICAQLAPEPIPTAWFTDLADGVLPEPLAATARAPLAYRRLLRVISRYGLATLDPDRDELTLHRLTQAVIRDLTPATDRPDVATSSAAVLAAAAPDDATDPTTWPTWSGLLPHLRNLDLTAVDTDGLADAASDAVLYLISRGDIHLGYALAHDLHQTWRQSLGTDHEHTVSAAIALSHALTALGRDREAADIDRQHLERNRQVLGDDHPDTLTSANNFALDLRALGEYQQARTLDEDTLTRRQRVLGDDHPHTLIAASNLALDLRALGENKRARTLNEDTLTRRQRLLGDDHPDTLTSASNLANDLHALGEYQQARTLDEDTLTRRRRVQGDDHPDTLTSASNLANDHRALGEHERADYWQAWAERDSSRPEPPVDL
jgi:hypothetical protein